MNIDYSCFYDRHDGISRDQVPAINAMLQAPLNQSEIAELAKLHSKVPGSQTVDNWTISLRDLPDSYVELLSISHGGGLTIGEREITYFEDVLLREYLLGYEFPVYMPGALPFGLNGGGVFYVFDMRNPPCDGEFPILVAHSSYLSFHGATLVAGDLHELLSDTTNVDELM